jgi:LacI family transcriptional regulator
LTKIAEISKTVYANDLPAIFEAGADDLERRDAGMARESKSTIHDVAQAAGVSATTVSRYLNNSLRLPVETTTRIDQAIDALRYRPNVLARRLLKGATEVIGLATPDIGNPFFAELASAVEARAAALGYSVILCSTGNRLEQELIYLERLASRHVDGLIFLTNHGDDGTLRRAFVDRRNIVLLDEDIQGLDVPKVFVENERGGYLATKCLLAAGHRRIAHVSGPPNLFSVRERAAGFRQAMVKYGLDTSDDYMLFGRYDREYGHEAATRLLALPRPPTAIFAASDYLVMGILDALRDLGLSAPEDLSLVGFDDMPFSSLLDPPITTVRQPIRALGERGVDALIARINKIDEPAVRERLPVTLIERASVGAPPGSAE